MDNKRRRSRRSVCGGETNFTSGKWVAEDTKVVIRYHTFPEAEEETEEKPEGNMSSDESG